LHNAFTLPGNDDLPAVQGRPAVQREGKAMTYREIAVATLVSAALGSSLTAHAQGVQTQSVQTQRVQTQGDQTQSYQDKGGGYVVMERPREHERVLFTAGVGFVPSIGRQFSEDAVGRLNDGRSTRATVDYDLKHAIDAEGGAIVMLNRSWGVGMTVSQSWSENVEIDTRLTVPSGEWFDTGRRKETAGHFEVTRVLFRRESQPNPFDDESALPTGYIIRVFGGPAFFRAKQSMVTLETDEIGMYTGTGWGYHAGLDVSMFTSMPGLAPGGLGFGGTLRYSDGNVRLAGLLGNGPSDRPAGGWNFSFGLRLRY
jgi:hypothetical protein